MRTRSGYEVLLIFATFYVGLLAITLFGCGCQAAPSAPSVDPLLPPVGGAQGSSDDTGTMGDDSNDPVAEAVKSEKSKQMKAQLGAKMREIDALDQKSDDAAFIPWAMGWIQSATGMTAGQRNP